MSADLNEQAKREVYQKILKEAFTPDELEELYKQYTPFLPDVWVLSNGATPHYWHRDPHHLMKAIKGGVWKMENEVLWTQKNGGWKVTKVQKEPD